MCLITQVPQIVRDMRPHRRRLSCPNRKGGCQDHVGRGSTQNAQCRVASPEVQSGSGDKPGSHSDGQGRDRDRRISYRVEHEDDHDARGHEFVQVGQHGAAPHRGNERERDGAQCPGNCRTDKDGREDIGSFRHVGSPLSGRRNGPAGTSRREASPLRASRR